MLVAALVTTATDAPASRDVAGKTVRVDGGGEYRDVTAAGLATMLERTQPVVVNVHVPYAGEINGTDLFVPFDRIAADEAKLPSKKDTRIVVYCTSGRMSAIAAATLVRLGYRDVWNLDGGMVAWERAGYPLLRPRR
jgi:rhodanese-related sulfurtransferase